MPYVIGGTTTRGPAAGKPLIAMISGLPPCLLNQSSTWQPLASADCHLRTLQHRPETRTVASSWHLDLATCSG